MAETEASSPAKAFSHARQRQKPLIVFFLDLDDVLITHRAAHGLGPGRGLFSTIDPVAMGLFNRLADKVARKKEADVRVVLISARRRDRGIRQHLQRNGLTAKFHRHWRTDTSGPRRGHEVERWLTAHPGVTDYQIFDDGAGFLPAQAPRHVRCQLYNGLTWENFLQAKQYFGLRPNE